MCISDAFHIDMEWAQANYLLQIFSSPKGNSNITGQGAWTGGPFSGGSNFELHGILLLCCICELGLRGR